MTNPSTLDELQSTTRAAKSAARPYAVVSASDRAMFLEEIASQLEALGDELIETAMAETNLPRPRLEGERGRTSGQLRMFANLIRSDAWLDIRIEKADPDRKPSPKPDLRQTKVPIGPVAVFGASNFPLAFSVAGGDTASALAAGCPVVCKAHPYHPQTSQLAANAITKAVHECGMPESVFSIVWGGAELGQALVQDPNISAVGFTGSLRAGRAIYDLAASREVPIPVFAEMGSVNPVFLMPRAMTERAEAIAQGYAGSLTMGVGQFCTNPGIVVGVKGPEMDRFLAAVTDALKGIAAGTMLHSAICEAYEKGVAARCAHPELETLCSGSATTPALFTTNAKAFASNRTLQEELFGPAGIVVVCESLDEMAAVAEALEGQLTISVHFDAGDIDKVKSFLPIFVEKAGRIVANGFPTGVEVNSAMQHGGPYPATTDSRSTSVGTAAILRFVRPVALQDFPATLLPTGLR